MFKKLDGNLLNCVCSVDVCDKLNEIFNKFYEKDTLLFGIQSAF